MRGCCLPSPNHFSIAFQQLVSCSQISPHVETHSAHAQSAHVPCDWKLVIELNLGIICIQMAGRIVGACEPF